MTRNIMRNLTLFAVFWAIALFSGGCRKDVLEIHPYPVSKAELALFMGQVPDPVSTTTFNLPFLNADKVLSTTHGARVVLTDVDQLFSASSSNAPVLCSTCADLRIELTTVTSKGDMIGRGLGTFTTTDSLLETGGMVELRAFCGNTELQLLPGRSIKIQLPVANPLDDMFVYSATTNSEGFKGWENSGQEVFKADWPGGSGTLQGYELNIARLGWSTCAKLLSSGATTPFCTTLQPSFTGLNTQVYLVFENKQVVVPMEFDNATYSFCFPNIPAGHRVKIVSVAKQSSEYWLGSTITETGTNSTLPMDVQQTSAQEILGYLRSL